MMVAKVCLLRIMLAILLVFCGSAEQVWAAKAATTTTLEVTANGSAATSVAAHSVVTFTATVKAGATALTRGQVKFCDADATYCIDIHLIALAQLTSAGKATFKFIPGIGNHRYKAVFLETTADAGSSSTSSALAVTGTYQTVSTITASGSTGNYTLTANVAGLVNKAGLSGPDGTVSFHDKTNHNAVVATADLGAATETLSWIRSSTVQAGKDPFSIAAADFNGDGIPDLAIGSFAPTSASIRVLLGNGDGTFTPAPGAPIVVETDFIVTGDFNADGIPDLVTLNVGMNKLTVFLGKGDGTFTPAAIPAAGNAPGDVAVGDFNGDGNADLAVTNYDDDTVSMLLGNGDGTFTATTATPVGHEAGGLTVADFNGDGILDLAVRNSTTALTVLLGKGDGTFTLQWTKSFGHQTSAIISADLNGDGIPDLVVTEGNSSIVILIGNGDGTFRVAPNAPPVVSPYHQLAIADFNQDGIPDLAITDVTSVVVLLGRGDGTFTKWPLPPLTNILITNLAVSDFNGDGLPDVATLLSEGIAPVYLTHVLENAIATATGVPPAGTGKHQVYASYAGESEYDFSVSSTVGLAAKSGPQASVIPSSLSFGPQGVDTESASQRVRITNTGNSSLAITGTLLGGAHPAQYLVSNGCATSLAPGASCDLQVRFHPVFIGGTLTALLSITDNGGTSPQTVQLAGTTTQTPVVTLSAASVAFGNQSVNTQSAWRTVTLTNTGNAALYLPSFALSGAHPGQFLTSNNCPRELAVGASCSLRLRFYPRIPGAIAAALTITDVGGDSPQSITLTGTGQ